MSRIFLRIFLSFWLAMVLIVAGSAWLNYWIWQQYGPGDVPELLRARMLRAVDSTVERLATGGEALRAGRRGLGRRAVHVIDAAGRSSNPMPLPPHLERLADLDVQPSRREGPDHRIVDVTAPDGSRYRVIGVVPVPPRMLSGGRRGTLMRLGVAVVVSALVCWLLAWFLLRPVQRLRRAAERLAAGDLGGRVSPEGRYERDELGALGRDFDHMAAALEASQQQQQQLLRDVSHELRSPLARLQVALELAREAPAAARAAQLDRIERETARLDALIGDILALARHEFERTPLERAPVDLGVLLQEVVEDARFEGRRDGRTVTLDLPPEPLVLAGDARLLARACDNLVRNALVHTPAGTAVEVSLARAGDQARLLVRDHGPGIPEDELERVFLPFHRVDRARSAPGHGIGLAIARQAVERHGGRIEAADAGPGLELRVLLPLAGG